MRKHLASPPHGMTCPLVVRPLHCVVTAPSRVLVACFTIATLGLAPHVAGAVPDRIEFNRDVRPILSDKCFACHGPDANKRQAELRLDEETALKDAERRIVVVGKPSESELISRITHSDPELKMPPGTTGKSLSDEEVTILRRWIEQGAGWQQHWSFLPPQKAALPNVASDAGAINAIDHFVLERLSGTGLSPNELADRRTLIRRLSFDLLGLPPQPAEVEAFLSDESAEAYERLVDRLLMSSHFGERMALYWLDVVRYADTGGYHSDNHRDVSLYRDYVIESFNNNLPFDQFTIEQIAGDLLPHATVRQKIASGYNRLLQTTEEGGAQPKEYTAKYLADRVRNTSVAWLGLTMGCAECHNHKFDPLTIADFYRFGAFFADVQEKAVGRQDQVALPTPEQEQQLAELAPRLAELRAAYQADSPTLQAARQAWLEQARKQVIEAQTQWPVVAPQQIETQGGTKLELQPDQSLLATGPNPDRQVYTLGFQAPEPRTVTAVRLAALTHPSLTNQSLSRANGNFVLTEVQLEMRLPDQPEAQAVKLASAVADFSQDSYPIAQAIDGKLDTGWAVDGHNRRENRLAMFVLAEPLELPAGATLTVRLRHESAFPGHNLGRLQIAFSRAPQPSLSGTTDLPAEVVTALLVEPDQRTDVQRQTLDRHFRTLAEELRAVREALAAAEKQDTAIRAAFPSTLISVSIPPRTVRILPRGNWLDDSGDVVEPTTPASLPGATIANRQQARLDLARWMVSREQPLTARVFVNRTWKLLFGAGLVRSLDDFGTQGTPPTHPELLDWLAVDFMESGWDVKRLVKLIVMSRTYRQSSAITELMRERDPENRLLARQGRFRLDAELVRDNALAIAGLLTLRVGGPSVKPYQPAGYWKHLNFPQREWKNDQGENLYRRGLYTYWQRSFLHPSLLAFDAPNREECTVERPRSNTPLQALVLLNDPTYVEAARLFATRMMQASAEFDTRLDFAYQQALNRLPSPQERAVLKTLYEKHLANYREQGTAAQALASVGQAPRPQELDPAELAATTSLARAILNLHETITRY